MLTKQYSWYCNWNNLVFLLAAAIWKIMSERKKDFQVDCDLFNLWPDFNIIARTQASDLSQQQNRELSFPLLTAAQNYKLQ